MRRQISGADKVARFPIGIAEKGADIPDPRLEVAQVKRAGRDRRPGGRRAGRIGLLDVSGGRIEQVLVMVNPDNLAGLVVARTDGT